MEHTYDTAADDHDVIAQSDVSLLHAIDDAGQRLSEGAVLPGQLGVQLPQLVSGHHLVLREAAGAEHAHILAEVGIGLHAQVLLTAAAVSAGAAGVDDADGHTVTHGVLLGAHLAAHLHDGADDLMAAQEGHLKLATGINTLLPGADGAAVDLHQNFVLLGLRTVDFHDFQLLGAGYGEDFHFLRHK